jgi:hypothetical protein
MTLLRLYSFDGRWIKYGHGALIEGRYTIMWKPKHAEHNMSRYHFVCHETHVDWPKIESDPHLKFPCDELASVLEHRRKFNENAFGAIWNVATIKTGLMCIHSARPGQAILNNYILFDSKISRNEGYRKILKTVMRTIRLQT